MGNSCYKVTGMGDILGLDWQSVKIIADALNTQLDEDILQSLKIIETEALKQFESRKDNEGDKRPR